MALRARKQLPSALWLSSASVLTGVLMYLLGAPEFAVIELSVGGGLVTILFVFAINITGEEQVPVRKLIPWPVSIALILGSTGAFDLAQYAGIRVYAAAI